MVFKIIFVILAFLCVFILSSIAGSLILIRDEIREYKKLKFPITSMFDDKER